MDNRTRVRRVGWEDGNAEWSVSVAGAEDVLSIAFDANGNAVLEFAAVSVALSFDTGDVLGEVSPPAHPEEAALSSEQQAKADAAVDELNETFFRVSERRKAEQAERSREAA